MLSQIFKEGKFVIGRLKPVPEKFINRRFTLEYEHIIVEKVKWWNST